MAELEISWVSGRVTKHQFDLDDSAEVGASIDSIEEGGGGTFPVEGGRLTIPPGQVQCLMVDVLADEDEASTEVTFND